MFETVQLSLEEQSMT